MIYPDVFNNERRFIFTNNSVEDFIGMWGGIEYLIKKGESKEFPMYLAYHLCKHFVDREITRAGRSSLLGVEEVRKEYEDKTIAEITGSTESPALANLKEEIRKEVIEIEVKKKGRKAKEVKTETKEEFADLK